ncbi:MAG: S8 family serine peptidase, partial [Ignavibacteria bacterium]|nr:S8 family serine peptidase [Ignavibacteria bacterium]
NYNYDIYWSGTSQSTAYVSGIASLLLSQKPVRTSEELKKIIISTAMDQVGDPREDKPGWDEYHGWGRVDLFAALSYEGTTSGNKELKKNNNTEESKNTDSKRAKSAPSDDKQSDDKRARKPLPDKR